MYHDEFTGKYHTHYREFDPVHNRWLSEDPAGYNDGLSLYAAYMGVNGVDSLGLWDQEGIISAYTAKYGDNEKAMKALDMVLNQYSLAQGDHWFDDWAVDHENKTINIASTSGFGWERSNKNAADQLYQVLADVFWEATELPETWGGATRRVAGGAGKTVGGAVSVVGGGILCLAPEPTTLTKIGGVGAIAFGANTCVDGTTQMFRRKGGINLINNAAGAYGQWMNGDEGEASARFWMSGAEIGFNAVGAMGTTNLGKTDLKDVYYRARYGKVNVGESVTRRWGGKAGPNGRSWTRDPYATQSRNSLGVETINSGEYVSHGTIVDNSGIVSRKALKWNRFNGGGDEVLIKGAGNKVRLDAVTMPDEPWVYSLPTDPRP